MTVPASLSKWAHPPRSNTPRSSSSGPPGACITPSTETCVVVVSFMVRPFSRVQVSGVTPVLRCWYLNGTSHLTQPEGKERDETQRSVGHLQRFSHERLGTLLSVRSLVHGGNFHIGKATYSCCLCGRDEDDASTSQVEGLPRQRHLPGRW